MNEKIVFFDIDGTLLGRDGRICLSTKEAISDLKKRGVYVAIATGRAPFMFESIRKELEIETFVGCNGQYVVLENEVIFEHELDPKVLKELIRFSNKKNHALVLLDHLQMKANQKYDPFVKESLASIDFRYPDYDPTYHEKHRIYQTLLFCEEKDESIYMDEFPEFDFVRWHPLSTDVLPQGGSKARGIQKIVEKLGTAVENVYAFGDGLNDFDMLKHVGIGVAMGNAVEEVKQVADYVTADVDEDGIANGLKHVGLLS